MIGIDLKACRLRSLIHLFFLNEYFFKSSFITKIDLISFPYLISYPYTKIYIDFDIAFIIFAFKFLPKFLPKLKYQQYFNFFATYISIAEDEF